MANLKNHYVKLFGDSNPDLSKFTESIQNLKVTDLIQIKFLMTDVLMNYTVRPTHYRTRH